MRCSLTASGCSLVHSNGARKFDLLYIYRIGVSLLMTATKNTVLPIIYPNNDKRASCIAA